MVRPGYGRERGRKSGGFGVPIEDPDPEPLDPANIRDGVRLDAPAVQIPLSAATELLDCRFEAQGIRRDFGYTQVGGPAQTRILGLGEHKFIDNDEEFHRLVRVRRNSDDNAVLEAWDGDSWIEVDTTSETIEERMLSMVSTQNLLVMTEGTVILKWGEVPQTDEIENDFPAGTTLTDIGDKASVEIPSADAFDGDYIVHYSVEIDGVTSNDKTLVLSFQVNDEEIDEKAYSAPASSASETWDHEDKEFFLPDLEDDDEISIKAKSFTADEDVSDEFSETGGTPEWQAEKSVVGDAAGKEYEYVYQVTIGAAASVGDNNGEVTVGYWKNDGSGWVKFDEDTWINTSDTERTLDISVSHVLEDMDQGDEFGMSLEDTGFSGGSLTAFSVDYEVGPTFSVKPFNKASDGDPHAGVTHEERTGTVSTFEALSADAPAARDILAWGDRLLAIGDTGDPQKLAWSVNGDIEDWTGAGSGEVSLLDAQSDPIDELMALASIGSDTAIILRKRSIVRLFLTGNVQLAVGSEPWIEGVGTESPHSVQQVRDGVMFLGHDYMVYYFNGGRSPQPVGKPIQRDLLERLSDENIERVDATFDPVFGEYWLKVPGRVWIFDLSEFLESQEIRWRARSVAPERLSVVSRI